MQRSYRERTHHVASVQWKAMYIMGINEERILYGRLSRASGAKGARLVRATSGTKRSPLLFKSGLRVTLN